MPQPRKPIDIDILYSAWASNGFTFERTGKQLGFSATHIRSEIMRLGLTKPKSLVDNAEITVDGKSRGLVLSDLHIPLTDWQFIDYMCEEAKRIKATDWLILAGDTLNQDSTSRYDDKQEDAGLEEERQQGKRGMAKLRRVFDRIIKSRGNHDERFVHTLGNKMSFAASVKMFLSDDALEVTGRDYILIDSPEGLWRACHTKTYSRLPLSVPAKIADSLRCHVIGGHRHHHAIGKSNSGYWAIENGCGQDYARTEYLHRWTTDHPKWSLGGTFLIDGVPYCPMLSRTPGRSK